MNPNEKRPLLGNVFQIVHDPSKKKEWMSLSNEAAAGRSNGPWHHWEIRLDERAVRQKGLGMTTLSMQAQREKG